MATGCANSYKCTLTASSSIFLPAMPQWLQLSEHLFHSLVIAPSGKKKVQIGQPVPEKAHWHELCSPATPPNDRRCRRGRRKKIWLKQISSIKESAQEEIYSHQSAKDCQNLLSIYLQSWEDSREVGPPRFPSVSARSKSKCSQFRNCVSWSCVLHRKCQSVPQYLVFLEIPFKACIRVSKTTEVFA